MYIYKQKTKTKRKTFWLREGDGQNCATAQRRQLTQCSSALKTKLSCVWKLCNFSLTSIEARAGESLDRATTVVQIPKLK